MGKKDRVTYHLKTIAKIGLVALVVLQCWFIHVTFLYPHLGIRLEVQQGQWKIAGFDNENVYINHALEIGDTIRSINGVPPEDYPTVRNWHIIEQADYIEISQLDEIKLIDLGHESRHPYSDVIPLSSEIVLLLLAGIVRWKDSSTKTMKMLSMLFVIMGTVYMSIGAALRGDIWGEITITSAIVLSPIVLFHFLLQFFQEKAGITCSKRWLQILYSLALLQFAAKFIYFLPGDFYTFFVVDSILKEVLFIIGLGSNLGWFAFISYRHRGQSPQLCAVIRYMWLWICIAFAPLLFLSYLPLLFGYRALVSPLLTSWFALTLPLCFVYLNHFKQLSDIEMILKRMMSVVLIAMVPGSIIVGLNAVIFVERHTFMHHLFSFGFIVIILAFLLYSYPFFHRKLMAAMYPDNLKLKQSLQRITQQLNALDTMEAWSQVILYSMIQTLQVKGAALIIKNPHNDIESYAEGELDMQDIERRVRSGKFHSETSSWFEVERHDAYVAHLMLTQKQNEDELNMEEREWVRQVISHMNIGMKKVMTIQKLNERNQQLKLHANQEALSSKACGTWMVHTLFDSQEKGRTKLAKVLQCGVMQPLHEASLEVEAMHRSAAPDESASLRQVGDRLDEVNMKLRHLCLSLQPKLILTAGLSNAIRQYMELEFQEMKERIHFEVDNQLMVDVQLPSFKLHLFRIVQELLINARKHAFAEHVHLSLAASSDHVLVSYQDDGVGFDPAVVFSSEEKVRGLKQLRARVFMLKGTMDWNAAPGEGACGEIQIPFPDVPVLPNSDETPVAAPVQSGSWG
ncbi:sensor histidine kinase [Paenibacillus apiarius]|uniref:sensor histidine kinase n=1 Tax=Paenibacillus apiarius TaxID=46240 RepID=UPI0019820953|nr:ATP-binding protein [Paenibacillus apiarius]MBN3522990.1 ATP-binding protein [Paenibacillus apiarius]